MKCAKCGTEFTEGIFCPECGTKYEGAAESIIESATIEPTEKDDNSMRQDEIEIASMMQENNLDNTDSTAHEINNKNEINKDFEKAPDNSYDSNNTTNVSHKDAEQSKKASGMSTSVLKGMAQVANKGENIPGSVDNVGKANANQKNAGQKEIPWYMKTWFLILLAVVGFAVNILWVPFLILLGMRIMFNRKKKREGNKNE